MENGLAQNSSVELERRDVDIFSRHVDRFGDARREERFQGGDELISAAEQRRVAIEVEDRRPGILLRVRLGEILRRSGVESARRERAVSLSRAQDLQRGVEQLSPALRAG